MAVTKTMGALHFEDLEPGRFEMLCMDIIYRMRRWERIDHFGAAGSDDGIDIQTVELLENGKRITHHFQCKRYRKLTKNQLCQIAKEYVEKNRTLPDYYCIVCGCTVSKVAIDSFYGQCSSLGFKSVSVWTASNIEAILFNDYHDLLFSFFGINLSMQRTDLMNSIRRNVALKKRMHRDFTKPRNNVSEIEIRLDEPWRKFIHSEVLIRSIYDKSYPNRNSLLNMDHTGFYKAEVYDWYHNGIMVRAHPYVINAIVRELKQNADYDNPKAEDYIEYQDRLEVIGCIPFENIIEYDIDGDECYVFPHLFCDFVNVSDPYETIVYKNTSGQNIASKDIIRFL